MRPFAFVVASLLSAWAGTALGQTRGAFAHTPPTEAPPGVALKLEGSVSGGPFSKVVVRLRSPGESYGEVPLELQYGDLYRGELPASRMNPPGVEYFVEGITPAGDHVAIFASAAQPVKVPIAGETAVAEDNPYTRETPKAEEKPDPARCKKKKGKKLPKDCDEPVAAKESEPAPAKTEPKKAEPAPVKTDTAKAEPTKSEPAKAEPTKSEPTKSEPVRATPPRRGRSELEEELAMYGAETTSGVVQRVDDAARAEPHATTVFTAAQLKQLGVRYVHEALDLAPGLSVSRDVQGFYRVSVRGLRSDAEVLFTLNGQRLNNFYDGKALASLPVDTLERIEVYRGPATADLGLGDVLAVVNLVTDREEGLRLSGSAGLYEAFDGHLSGAKAFGPVKLFIDGDVVSQYGVRRPVLRDGLDPVTTPRLKTTRDNRFLVNVGAGGTFENDGLGALTLQGRFMLENRTPLIGLFDVVGNDSKLQWQVVQAALSWRKSVGEGSALSARAWLDLQTTNRLWQISYPGYQARPADPATLFSDGVQEQVTVGTRGIGAEVRGDFALPFKNRLVATVSGELQSLTGYEYLINYVPGSLVNRGQLLRPDALGYPTEDGKGGRGPAADRFDLGVSVYDTWSLFDAVAVQAGVRFDLLTLPKVDASGAWAGTALTPGFGPRLGLVVKPVSSLVLRGTYGRSFRAPTVQELAEVIPSADSSQGRLVGNRLLAPAAIDSVEASFEYLQAVGDGKLRLRAQGFFERLQNAIAGVDTSGNLVPYANRPLGEQAVGLEGEARLELTPRATVWLNTSWVRAEDLGTPASARLLTDVPQVRFNAGVSLPLGPYLAFDVVFRYASERRNNSRSVLELIRRYSLPAYATVAAQLRTELLFEHLELSVLGQNVFNMEYADDAARPDRVAAGVPRETVQVFANAKVVF